MSSPQNSKTAQAAALRRIASLRGIDAMSKKSPAAAKFFSQASKLNPSQRAGLQAYYNSTHKANTPQNPNWRDAHKLGPLGTGGGPTAGPVSVQPGPKPTNGLPVGSKLGSSPSFPTSTTQPVPSPLPTQVRRPNISSAIKRRLKVS